jgi:hypothetical protein
MQCNEVEMVLEQEGLAPLPEAAREHLAGCSACQNLLADLTSVVELAHELPAELDPPDRVWISLRAQLETEGVIKTPAAIMERGSWWRGFEGFFNSRALATAMVGLMILVAGVLQTRAPVATEGPLPDPIFETAKVLNDQERGLTNMQLASTSTVDNSLRENLQTVDEFIADCERHLKADPRDDLAREYLSSAYQQKADLLSAMMERGGSEH